MSLRRWAPFGVSILCLGLVVGVFQNCSRATFTSIEDTVEGQASLSSCDTPDCQDIRSGVAACFFDGQELSHGHAVIAYQNSSVPFGQSCVSQARQCDNGVLSGSYQFPSCAVGEPAACQFNGAAVPSGQTVTAYLQSSVVSPASCQSEQRACLNGVLAGSYQFSSCQVNAPASCEFNGRTVASGSSVIAFRDSAVPFGSSCVQEVRTCTNGVLSGSFSRATCEVGQPASCMFNGQTVASGQSVTAYRNSSVAFGQTCASESRQCVNGSLSGSFANPTCVVDQPASCMFNGRTVAHGQAVNAFLNSTEAFGASCRMESRVCSNGRLSGSYEYGSCNVNAPASCVFNGQTIAHGASVNAYPASAVAFGSSCRAESRTCSNGSLSGSAQFASCVVNQPRSCLFNGQTVAHGARVTAYQSSAVPFGSSCSSEARVCNDGSLGGSFQFGSCVVNQPASCLFNGKTVAHGSSIVGYKAASVKYPATCETQTRSCSNGALSGTYAAGTCAVIMPMWVNVISSTETHAQACARVGGLVPTDKSGVNGQGICAAPESQPLANGGDGAMDIVFRYGVGKYSGNRRGGGQVIVARGSSTYCYKPGQKQDNDKTDLLVAYLCLRP